MIRNMMNINNNYNHNQKYLNRNNNNYNNNQKYQNKNYNNIILIMFNN